MWALMSLVVSLLLQIESNQPRRLSHSVPFWKQVFISWAVDGVKPRPNDVNGELPEIAVVFSPVLI